MAARLAIIATVITSDIAFWSSSFAAGDADIGSLGDKMSGAFKCSIYAQLFDDQKEQKRLFQIGLKAGRDLVEGIKGGHVFGDGDEFFASFFVDVFREVLIGTKQDCIGVKRFYDFYGVGACAADVTFGFA